MKVLIQITKQPGQNVITTRFCDVTATKKGKKRDQRSQQNGNKME